MIKLIRLEWRKWNIKKYIRYVLSMTVALLLFLAVTAGKAGADTVSMGFHKRSVINAAVELYSNMSYIVLAGVMLASFIVGEYEKGTIGLMFSYPIRRKKIVVAKIISVWCFCVMALILSKVFIYFSLLIMKSFINISISDIPIYSTMFWADTLLSSIIMISISFLALPVGLKTKSSKAAIVASVLIACFSHGNIMGYTFLGNIYYYGLLIFGAIVFTNSSIRKIDYTDVT